MTEQLLVEQDPTKCLIGRELVRVFYACAKLATIQSHTYYAPRNAMNGMAWVGRISSIWSTTRYNLV